MNTDEHNAALPGVESGPNLLNEAVRFLHIVRRKLPILIGAMVVGGMLGTLWYVTATRMYESTSEIMVLKTEGNVLDGSNTTSQRTIQDIMPTYQKVLTSDRVLEGAILKLPKEHLIDLQRVPKYRRTAELKRNTTVTSTRMTSLLSVRYMSRNAKTAAFVVNAIVESYLEYMQEIHKGSSKESLDLLSNEKNQIELMLLEKEQELLKLKIGSGILIQGSSNTHPVIQTTLRLNEALVEAQRKTLEARALVLSVKYAVSTGADIQPFLQQAAGDVSRDFLMREMGIGTTDASAIAKREEEVLNDQHDLQTKLKFYGPNHPQILQLQARIEQNQMWLDERAQVVSNSMKEIREGKLGPKLLEMVKQRYFQTQAHEEALRKEFELLKSEAVNLNGQMAEIDSAETNIKRMRAYYELILAQIAKVDIGASSGLKISVTTPAKVIMGPVAPKISTTVILCIFLGALAGMGIIYVMDVLDDRFRSPDELQIQCQTPLLAMIREMEPIEGTGLERVVTYAKADSLESEAFRTLRSSVTFSSSETKRIVVTSTEPGDGKTTTLANLAVAFAQAKKKTLLIDADLRRPGMTTLLDLKGPRGLSQVLKDTRPVAESCLENIFNLGIENLDVMPSGSRPGNPSELLASERLHDIIVWAESLYDQILIDAPPVLAVTDPAIIGRVVDGAIVVIRPDKNRRKMVLRAIDSFRATGVHVVGIVANHIAIDSNPEYGFGYGYGYGYGYGHDEEREPDEETATTESAPTGYEIEERVAA